MLQEPLPDPQPDDDEPVGSGPAGDSGAPWQDDDARGPEQGLFVCLPAEELSLAGFAQNGQADTMAPGPLLGMVLHTVIGEDGAGLPGLSDDQLIGVLSGGRRMEAWTAWVQLAAMRELARRRPAVEPGDSGRAGFSDFAADELMGEFHLTLEAATAQIGYACTVAERLPRTFAALAAGQIHPVAVKIIEDETRYLSAKNVAKADAVLAELARSKSFGRLRYAAHRLVLSVTTILRNPAVAGLRAYTRREQDADGKTRAVRTIVTDEHGEPVRGQWDAALDEDTWRAVTALLDAPGRKPQQGVRTLLGGLMRCRCGNTVIGSVNATGKHVYRCNPQTRGDRPGPHAQQMTGPVDSYVEKVITARLARRDLADLVTPKRPDTGPLHREAAVIRRNLEEMAGDRALGLVTREQMIAATRRGGDRLAEIEAQLAASASTSALAPFASAGDARAVWDDLDRERRRAVIDALAEVIINPAGRGARVFDPRTVGIAWRGE